MAAPPQPAASTSSVAVPASLDTTNVAGEAALSFRRGSTRIRDSFAALAAQEKGKFSMAVSELLLKEERVEGRGRAREAGGGRGTAEADMPGNFCSVTE